MPSVRKIALALPIFLLPALSAPSPHSLKLASRQPGPPAETTYQCFKGTTFPSPWLSWDELLAINKPTLLQANSPEIVDAIISAIWTVSKQAEPQILPEFILAQIMQETGGAPLHLGDSGKSHGLLQVQLPPNEPPVDCGPGGCTADDILGMVQQGILGHRGPGAPTSPGFALALQQQDRNIGAALRVYNTGQVPDPNNYQAATACSTSSYVSDIGNRLLGLPPDKYPGAEWLSQNCGFPMATTTC